MLFDRIKGLFRAFGEPGLDCPTCSAGVPLEGEGPWLLPPAYHLVLPGHTSTDAITCGRVERLDQNWLRVFRSAEASRLGHTGSQLRQTRAVRSEKCVALRNRWRTEIGVIAVCFAHVLRGYTGHACLGFLLILQEVRRVGKTRNQFKASTCWRTGASAA